MRRAVLLYVLTLMSVQGGTVVFADIDPATLCIDPTSVEKLLTDRTKAKTPLLLPRLYCLPVLILVSCWFPPAFCCSPRHWLPNFHFDAALHVCFILCEISKLVTKPPFVMQHAPCTELFAVDYLLFNTQDGRR